MDSRQSDSVEGESFGSKTPNREAFSSVINSLIHWVNSLQFATRG